jgi:iron(II)-dependent oxidoreductase
MLANMPSSMSADTKTWAERVQRVRSRARTSPDQLRGRVQAESYCAWTHARLPTEIEWEWAARGGKAATVFPWGSAFAGAQLCWSGVTKRRETCPVGALPSGSSTDGASDLAGNVAEWTSTEFRPSLRIVRGGSFSATDPKGVGWRVFEYQKTDRRDETLGVRCVTSAPR